ncbi:MAG: PEGA domain-containing protein [Candidatus Shapirobacteria bacterium]|jgi:hypothetical protein
MSAFFLGGCSLVPKKSALEINSYPVAKVYVDGKEVGMTPYRNRTLVPGEVEIKLVTNDKLWLKKIKLQNNINTVIDWEFGKTDEESGGYILYLEKTGDKNKAGLMINTNPDKTTITIDNEIKGLAPMRISDIDAGDKHLALSFPNYKTIDIFMKSINGYQLVVDASLAEDKTNIIEEEAEIKSTDLSTSIATTKIKIKETETGWLKVREASSSASKEITRVNPGETYSLLEEQTDWYKIDLGNGKNGWISIKYGEKSE